MLRQDVGIRRSESRLLILTVFLVLAVMSTSSVHATDPPHWTPGVGQDCAGCHMIHQALGGGLTVAAGNVNLCQTCHNPAGQASDLPIYSSDVAVPGVSGTSHGFDVPAVNAAYDVQLPLDPELEERVMDGNVVCSTCHNQHLARAAFGGTPRISTPQRQTALGSTGTLSSGGVYSGAAGSWYLVEIESAGDETSATFRYSKDNATSWMASGLAAGNDVALDDGVTVSFAAGSYQVGERWQFYGSWPFLRTAMDSGDNASGAKFCRDCHRAWVMDDVAVNTGDGSYKSHPVGVGLGTGSRTYDFATPLDGNGAVQGSGGADANPGNDLQLDASGFVQCLSCHGIHYADGNTQTASEP